MTGCGLRQLSIWTDLGRESITRVLGIDCDSFVVAGYLRTPKRTRPPLNGWHLNGGTDQHDLAGDIEAYVLEFASRLPNGELAIHELKPLTSNLEVSIQFSVLGCNPSVFLAPSPSSVAWLNQWCAEFGIEFADPPDD
ncbi:MAG: hypothetical protein RLZZ104_1548 [Pseudomonadota bacterium]